MKSILAAALLCAGLSAPLVLARSSMLPEPAPERQVASPSRSLPVGLVRRDRTKPVTTRKPNTMGRVLVLEYHRIAEEGAWTRSAKKFRADLARLYQMGFRPVTVSEIASGKFDIPKGASPVAITFDDSDISQYRILKDGTIDPDCAIGIWRVFSVKHPDFPVKGTFYVLPSRPFGQRAWVGTKLRNLREWGSEIGSHTLSHKSLGSLTDDEVKQELAGSIEWLRKLGIEPTSLATPYGVRPKNHELLSGFTWNGKQYGFKAVTRVGAAPAWSPNDKRFDPHNIWRVLGEDGQERMSQWLARIEKGKIEPYVQP